ncbi:MAG: hypothetical protein IPG71_10740 [bacterium]|nr:hypothetical protein [bacterium]
MTSTQPLRRQTMYVALGTAALLMVPFIAMQFTAEVNWTLSDFIFMGVLLFGTGMTYVLVTKSSTNPAYRLATGLAVLASFLLIWINLAVGLIGSEDNPANALYLGVLIVEGIGAAAAFFRPRGMTYTMFATAIAQFLVPVIAMIIWRPSLDEPAGVVGVFMLNSVFAGMFAMSALLFRRASATAV